MSGLYWLAIFLCVSRYESAEEECKEMFMQKMEKHNVMLVLLAEQRTMQYETATDRGETEMRRPLRVSTTSWNLMWWMIAKAQACQGGDGNVLRKHARRTASAIVFLTR